MQYVCPICGYVYDEEKEGKPFAQLPDSWTCPLCGADKSVFAPAEEREVPKAPAAPVPVREEVGNKEDMKKLSTGELSALCSNLARGCEKQYKEKEAALYRQLADYFAAITPAVPGADMEQLAALIQSDLKEGYSAVRLAAEAEDDRGAKRSCVWGEKVTAILNSLISRYQKEGDAFLRETQVWVCTVCGFVYVGDTPPELCPVCKVPAWKFEKIEGRVTA